MWIHQHAQGTSYCSISTFGYSTVVQPTVHKQWHNQHNNTPATSPLAPWLHSFVYAHTHVATSVHLRSSAFPFPGISLTQNCHPGSVRYQGPAGSLTSMDKQGGLASMPMHSIWSQQQQPNQQQQLQPQRLWMQYQHDQCQCTMPATAHHSTSSLHSSCAAHAAHAPLQHMHHTPCSQHLSTHHTCAVQHSSTAPKHTM